MNEAAEYAAHAARARQLCRAAGLADCIHYAPDRNARADKLYALANASGLPWYEYRESGPGLFPDGRMVLASPVAYWFEPSSNS